MKKIIYGNAGGVSIITPCEAERLKDETDDEFAARIGQKDAPAGAAFQIVDESAIPSDRTFRNAWMADLSVDMPKALFIAQAAVREARAPKLAALDVEFMRAVESADQAKQAQIAAQKQRLRDATADSRLVNAQTPEALKSAMQAVISEL